MQHFSGRQGHRKQTEEFLWREKCRRVFRKKGVLAGGREREKEHGEGEGWKREEEKQR